MQQKFPANNFEWIKYTSELNEYFIKTIMKKVLEDFCRKARS